MLIVASGNFVPEELLEEIKKRLINKPNQGQIKRIYPEEPAKIHKQKKEEQMEVSNPMFVIGFKDEIVPEDERVKRHIAVEILLTIIFGHSSKLYKKLYESGYLLRKTRFRL